MRPDPGNEHQDDPKLIDHWKNNWDIFDKDARLYQNK